MEQKLDAISNYLKREFADCDVEHHEDFDRSAQAFKVHAEAGTLLLKLSDEFIYDSSVKEIEQSLEGNGIAAVLTANPDLGIMLTQEGIVLFERD